MLPMAGDCHTLNTLLERLLPRQAFPQHPSLCLRWLPPSYSLTPSLSVLMTFHIVLSMHVILSGLHPHVVCCPIPIAQNSVCTESGLHADLPNERTKKPRRRRPGVAGWALRSRRRDGVWGTRCLVGGTSTRERKREEARWANGNVDSSARGQGFGRFPREGAPFSGLKRPGLLIP